MNEKPRAVIHPSAFILPPFQSHWSFSGQDTAPVMRQRGFESHPVLFRGCRLEAGDWTRSCAGDSFLQSPAYSLLFDNLARTKAPMT